MPFDIPVEQAGLGRVFVADPADPAVAPVEVLFDLYRLWRLFRSIDQTYPHEEGGNPFDVQGARCEAYREVLAGLSTPEKPLPAQTEFWVLAFRDEVYAAMDRLTEEYESKKKSATSDRPATAGRGASNSAASPSAS